MLPCAGCTQMEAARSGKDRKKKRTIIQRCICVYHGVVSYICPPQLLLRSVPPAGILLP